MDLTNVKEKVRDWKRCFTANHDGVNEESSWKEIFSALKPSHQEFCETLKKIYAEVGPFTPEEMNTLRKVPYYKEVTDILKEYPFRKKDKAGLYACKDSTPMYMVHCFELEEKPNISFYEVTVVPTNLPAHVEDLDVLFCYMQKNSSQIIIINYAEKVPLNWLQIVDTDEDIEAIIEDANKMFSSFDDEEPF